MDKGWKRCRPMWVIFIFHNTILNDEMWLKEVGGGKSDNVGNEYFLVFSGPFKVSFGIFKATLVVFGIFTPQK